MDIIKGIAIGGTDVVSLSKMVASFEGTWLPSKGLGFSSDAWLGCGGAVGDAIHHDEV